MRKNGFKKDLPVLKAEIAFTEAACANKCQVGLETE